MDGLYLKGLEQLLLGNIQLEAHNIRLAFMAPGYTPDFSADQFYSDISGDIAAGTTDVLLTNVDVRIDTGNSRVEVDSDNVSEGPVTATTDKYVLYRDTGTPATSPLICCINFTEGDLSPVGGTLALTVNAEGHFSISST